MNTKKELSYTQMTHDRVWELSRDRTGEITDDDVMSLLEALDRNRLRDFIEWGTWHEIPIYDEF